MQLLQHGLFVPVDAVSPSRPQDGYWDSRRHDMLCVSNEVNGTERVNEQVIYYSGIDVFDAVLLTVQNVAQYYCRTWFSRRSTGKWQLTL